MMSLEQLEARLRHVKLMNRWYRLLTWLFVAAFLLMMFQPSVGAVTLFVGFALAFCILGYDLIAGRIKEN